MSDRDESAREETRSGGSEAPTERAEERMREEFAGVRTLHLPMHAVLRIEEVEKRGTCMIRDRESGEKVTPFPLAPGKKPG